MSQILWLDMKTSWTTIADVKISSYLIMNPVENHEPIMILVSPGFMMINKPQTAD